ncbi:MAG: bifunctional UDP-N-acetylglucosamine diphosphorylase/glucosamine-1-phosphate N-acetyltransferase GlmU [Pseudomonadota bacterium]
MQDQAPALHVILAAGEGTRMRSTVPKVLHEVASRPMVGHVIHAVLQAAPTAGIALVRGPGHDAVEVAARQLAPDASVHLQTKRLGTAHAVLAARDALEAMTAPVIVLFGDTPLVRSETVVKLHEAIAEGAGIAVVGFEAGDPTGYGRLLMRNGQLEAIREEKDATPEEQSITLCNGGIMAFAGPHVLDLLDRIGNDNAKGEYYLTDAIGLARADNLPVVVVMAPEEELAGVNTRAQLAAAEAVMQDRLRVRAMEQGATLQDPSSVMLSADTVLGRDVVIEPNVVFGPGVTVADECRIRAFSHLEGVDLGMGVVVGPFARLRPGTVVAAKARIGNFVEVKNARIDEGAKLNHLTYVGDAHVGAGANLGAGTITCNYDGVDKHHTEIGEGAFIGSNSALVAPVTIGDGAYVGSGSVITEDVPDRALAIGRGRQVTKADRAPDPNRPKRSR